MDGGGEIFDPYRISIDEIRSQIIFSPSLKNFRDPASRHVFVKTWIAPAFELGRKATLCFLCQDPGSNWGPFPLQGNALPTELSQHTVSDFYFKLTRALAFLYSVLNYL